MSKISVETVPLYKNELCKQVPGFSQYYATSHGRIYSRLTSKFLTPDTMEKGYKRVTLFVKGKRYRMLVHRIVAATFLHAPAKEQTEVNHIDHDPANNKLSNLEWVTRKENQDKSMLRYITANQGEKSNLALLTADRVDAIRCLLANGFSTHKLARIFNTSRSCISKIQKGKSWKNYNGKQ